MEGETGSGREGVLEVKGGVVGDVVFYGPAAFVAAQVASPLAEAIPNGAGSPVGTTAALVAVFALVGALVADLGLPGSLIGILLGRRGRYFGRWAGRFSYDGRVGHSAISALGATIALSGLLYVGPAFRAPLIAFCGAYLLHLAADQLTGRHPVYWVWPVATSSTGALAPVLGRRVASGTAAVGRKVEETVLGWIRPNNRPQRTRQRTRNGRKDRPGPDGSSSAARKNTAKDPRRNNGKDKPRRSPDRALRGGN